jgi:hypothetical protein
MLATGEAHVHGTSEHLEALVLAGVQVRRRRPALGPVGSLDLEQLGIALADRDGLARGELERDRHV